MLGDPCPRIGLRYFRDPGRLNSLNFTRVAFIGCMVASLEVGWASTTVQHDFTSPVMTTEAMKS